MACKENWPVTSFLPKALNDVEPNKLKISDPSSLQQKMAIIQQVGAKIHRLQQVQGVIIIVVFVVIVVILIVACCVARHNSMPH